MDVMWTVRFTMFSHTASAASVPSAMRTPRAYRPSPTLASSAVVGRSFHTLVAPVRWMRCMLLSTLVTSSMPFCALMTRPSTKFGSTSPAATSCLRCAAAASGANEPSVLAPTTPVTAAVPSTAPLRNFLRSNDSMSSLPPSAVDRDGREAGGQAGDRAVRGRRQVDQPVGGAVAGAARPFAAPQIGLRPTVRDLHGDLRRPTQALDEERVPAGLPQEVVAAAVGAGDGEAGVGRVRPGAVHAAGPAVAAR